jgi:hypothetical protein
MQVDIHWENENKTILRVTCVGVWAWADMAAAIPRWEAVNSIPDENYCLIVDLRAITALPSDTVLHLKDAAQLSLAVNGLIVVITSSSATSILFKMFVSMYRLVGGKFRAATSDAEAYALLGLPPPQATSAR